MKKLKGTLFLFFAALIWGVTFVTQTTVSDSLGSFTFNCERSVVAAIFLGGVLLVRRLIGKAPGYDRKRTLVGGAVCGVLLFVAANLQQFGIALYPPEAAASGRAGFITATYVVMTALWSLVRGERLRPLLIVSVVGCIAGMYMLCLSEGIGQLYLGDVIVFLCAIGFTVYILFIDKYNDTDGITLSCTQFAVCAVLSGGAALIFESPFVLPSSDTLFAVLFAGIMSSGIGYTFQIIGQKYAPPTLATIVMSLESVFAALAGWLILSERLKPVELIGCVLVFASVIAAQMPDKKSSPKAAGKES